jgi:hypothetical protein
MGLKRSVDDNDWQGGYQRVATAKRFSSTPGYGAEVQLGFFVVNTTKKADGTEVAHEPLVNC